MNNDNGNGKTDETSGTNETLDTTPAYDETIVMDTTDDDAVIDGSAEVNVEELVAKIDDSSEEAERKRAARRKLDELEERKKVEEDLGDTYNINLDDEF